MRIGKERAFVWILLSFFAGVLIGKIPALQPSAAEQEGGSYTIVFHEDFGEEENGTMRQTVSFGETATLRQNPWEHEGYRFAGWYASGVGVNHNLANAYPDEAEIRDLALQDGEEIHLYAGWAIE